ncbi:MAG: hypothetical protein AB7D51_04010 [Desulfovibrionaceae bacterium]
MSLNVHCPYCSFNLDLARREDYRPFYHTCPACSGRVVVEPVRGGFLVFREGEAPCCSDPECRAVELAGTGQD